MSIISYLIKDFLKEETGATSIILITSVITNLIQAVGFSRITAEILSQLQSKNFPKAYLMFRYFIYVSLLYIGICYIYRIFQNKILSKLYQWTRFQLVRMLLIVNNEEFSNDNFTTVIAPINRVSSTTFNVLNDIITFYIPNCIFLCVSVAYILYQHSSIGIAFILGNLIWILYLYFKWRPLIKKNREYEKQLSHTENYLIEMLNNIDKIISRGQTFNELNILSNKKDVSSEKSLAYYSYLDNNLMIVNTIVLLTTVVCLGLGIRLYTKGIFNHITFVSFFTILLMYRERIVSSLHILPEFIETMGRSEILLERFNTIIDKYDETKNKIYKEHNLTFEDLVLDNVCFEYNDTVIFKDMNLHLQTTGHSIIGITGPSGKGKSTMCKMFLKMYKCNRGSVYIDGVNIDDLDPLYIRTNITYVNQNAKLFDKKVLENILYGCQNEDICKDKFEMIIAYPKIQELFKEVDINEDDCGQLGEKLSGGQRQIVNIISGLINPCRILMLDEPTNSLDKPLKLELLEIIKRFKNDKQAIIIISHDKDVYPLFDKHIEI